MSVHVVYHLTLSRNFNDIDSVISKLRSNEFVIINKSLSNCLVFEKYIDANEISNFLDHAKNILASVTDLKFVLSMIQIDNKGIRVTSH